MSHTPLPEKLRPQSLDDYIGQKKLVGENGIIRKLLHAHKSAQESFSFPSLIFWGPPGSGKTTLARILAKEIDREFYEFSAVSASVKDIQNVVPKSYGPQQKLLEPPFVFLDEIHRFNKAQQDRLLPHVEKGEIILIGATTENPSFEVIGPLLSRARVLTLEKLEDKELAEIIKRGEAVVDRKLDKKAKEFLQESSNGDARVLLNTLEIASSIHDQHPRGDVNSHRVAKIGLKDIEEALQRHQYSFDKKGEEHYNVISAFIKSMRASQTDAALYYLARMVEGGQDPLYIARRMVIFASEDIGMAQPTALVVANEVFQACQTIGYPECAINLAHGVVYLSKAKKDRRSYDGLQKALTDVRKYGNLPVPLNVRNAPTKLMKELGYGMNYKKYDTKSYLPEKLKGKKYYQ